VIDCFDGLVVSWTIGTRPDAEPVSTMLDAAISTVANSDERPVVYSDRGAHYRWPGWLSRMRDAGLIRSMSRKGCSPDITHYAKRIKASLGFLSPIECRERVGIAISGQ
jgi:transposase InsO family protein